VIGGVVDTSDKFISSINDNAQLLPVSATPVSNYRR
jgi:hypothetical protein